MLSVPSSFCKAAGFFFLIDDVAQTIVPTPCFLELPELEGSVVKIGITLQHTQLSVNGLP
jgi:hypothetical protein